MDSGTVAELRGLAVSSGVARAPCKAQVPVNAGAALALHKKTTTSWCRCSLCCQLCHVAHVCVEATSQTFSGSPTGLGGGRHAVQQLVFMCTFVDIAVDGLCGL